MTIWTEDRIARLKTLWREGHTAAFIAQDLDAGISRSAVLGKVHRLGLARGRNPVVRPGATGRPPTPATGTLKAAARPARRASAPASASLEPQRAAGPAPLCGTRTVRSVGPAECRWPFGDPRSPAFRFCGCPATRGAFCAAHASFAYRPAPRDLDGLFGLA